VSSQWVLSVDGSSNQQGSGVGVVLEGPNGLLIEQALRFAFKAKEMGARSLLAKSDSQLVTGQVPSQGSTNGSILEICPVVERGIRGVLVGQRPNWDFPKLGYSVVRPSTWSCT